MTIPDVTVEFAGHVAMVEIHRPPNNYIDTALIKCIADAYERDTSWWQRRSPPSSASARR